MGSCGPPRAGFRDGSQRSCITVRIMDDGVQTFMRAMDDGFPAVETMTAAGGAGGARRPTSARREPRRRGERRRPPYPRPGRRRAGADLPPARRQRVASRRWCSAHGGGFVLCDLDSHDSFCRAMSRHTETVVVSVDYRLAPEHRAPAAAEDVFAAWCWAIGARRRPRHRPGASADRRRQRGRQPGRRHRADVPRAAGRRCPPGRC